MANTGYLYLGLMLGVVVLNTAAQFLFKFGIRTVDLKDISTLILNLPLLTGYVFFFVASLLYLYVIRHVPLSTAFPTTILIHALVLVGAYFLFGEEIGKYKMIGIALIFSGVYFIWQ